MIQVGQVLDKYELLERVGQGGMAIVYRGLDRQLKRTVAIKILHKHLSDYQEARDRFEREAQAVAKLRHENILEIFDYASATDAEREGASYIVTEFIDGQTLKQFITERPIAYPEIGAMIILQVCRALAHAHAAGILHRDIKPENIMIRGDGVVKLMDFGISHMVDLERLTVTGQLLGSPAYMAPEHVEGRPLDFRTDVFAVGIVLYQLTVGKLPFEGKNPHEVLKRIAECRFVDPRQANPRLGNRLGRIILRAMAEAPADRFPAIGEMVLALEGYLEESGIAVDKVAAELARYFQSPVSYEAALRERLIDHLTRRGAEQIAADDRSAALDVFDRVLTLDPENAKVLGILDGIARKKRLRTGALAAGGAVLLGVCAWMVHRQGRMPDVAPPPPPTGSDSVAFTHHVTTVQKADPPPSEDAPVPDAAAAPPDAAGIVRTSPPTLDAPALAVTRIRVTPATGSKLRVGDGVWLDVPPDGIAPRTLDRDLVVTAMNACCEPAEILVHAGQPDVELRLHFQPARVKATCEVAGAVSVRIEGEPATLGQEKPIFFERDTLLDTKNVTVEFVLPTKIDSHTLTVRAGGTTEVACAP